MYKPDYSMVIHFYLTSFLMLPLAAPTLFAQSPVPYIQSAQLDGVNTVAVSPDGRCIAYGTGSMVARDGSVHVRSALNGLEFVNLGEAAQPLAAVYAMAFLPDSCRLAFGTRDGRLHIWDIAANRPVWESANGRDMVVDIKISPDGQRLASCDIAGRLSIRMVDRPDQVVEYPNAFAFSLAWSADGSRLAMGSRKDIRIVDVQTGAVVKTLHGHDGRVSRVSYLPDQKRMASTSWDRSVRLWDIDSGQEIRSFPGHSERVVGLAVSPDGKILVSSDASGDIRKFDIETGRQLNHGGGGFTCNDIAYLPDGSAVAMAYSDPRNATVLVWDLKMRAELLSGKLSPGSSFAFDAGSGALLQSTLHGGVTFWNLAELRPTYSGLVHKQEVFDTVIAEGGARAWTLSGDGTIRRFDLGASVAIAHGPTVELGFEHKENMLCSRFLPADESVLIGCVDGQVLRCSLEDGGVLSRFKLGDEPITNIEILPGGTIIACSGMGNRNSASILEGEKFTLRGKFELPPGTDTTEDYAVLASTVANDGSCVAFGTTKGRILLVDVDKGQVIRHWQASTAAINALTFDSAGRLYSAGDDRCVRSWNSVTGTQVAIWTYHQASIRRLELSPDKESLISVAADGAVRFMTLETGHWIGFGTSIDGSQWIVFTDDGYWDGSANCQELVAMVQGTDAYGVDQFAARHNRPDIILQRMAVADQALIAHFQAQYLKRLQKQGLREASAVAQAVPEARILTTSQVDRQLKITVSLNGKKQPLNCWNLWVNGVPQFGGAGRPIRGFSLTVEETVQLNPGANKIEVSCLNDAGLESYRVSIGANWAGKVEPHLYFLGFGVSDYADKSLTLNWAAKDALDLAQLFRRLDGKGYERVVTHVWTDAQVTPLAIAEAKAILSGARPEDTLVLFISGHGVHDNDVAATYYYLTRDTDRNNLPRTAVSFEAIESILQDISPRSKLFLMDTCESGESDDARDPAMLAGTGTQGVHARDIGVARRRPIAPLVQAAVKLKDRWIYNDIVKRTGAVVFSSSQGNEASYEFDDLQNGAFTAALKASLADPSVDQDKDGFIASDELLRSVQKLVGSLVRSKVGKDAQHPTIDRTNRDQVVKVRVVK